MISVFGLVPRASLSTSLSNHPKRPNLPPHLRGAAPPWRSPTSGGAPGDPHGVQRVPSKWSLDTADAAGAAGADAGALLAPGEVVPGIRSWGGGSLWSQARRVKVLLFMAFWTHVGLTDQQCCQATRGFAAFGHCFGVSLRIIVVDLDPT